MQVLQLRPLEGVRVDQTQLGAFYEKEGTAQAEETLCRAMEEISLWMTKCDTHYRAGKYKSLKTDVSALAKIADQIGLHSLSRVAQDVLHCIDIKEETALAATLSRLIRTGERSLIAIWDMQDAKT